MFFVQCQPEVHYKVPKQKAKFSSYKDEIFIANPRSFSNQCSVSASKFSSSKSSHLIRKSHLIRQHTSTQSAFKDTQWALKDSSHSEDT